jgi:hypothetical protein
MHSTWELREHMLEFRKFYVQHFSFSYILHMKCIKWEHYVEVMSVYPSARPPVYFISENTQMGFGTVYI